MEENSMFRYLEKYIGTYRVRAYYDLDTNDFPKDDNGKLSEYFDDLYIKCKKGEIRHTYTPNTLCWMIFEKLKTGRNTKEDFTKAGIKHEYEEIGDDVIIYFDEADFKKVATIVKPEVNGKSIKPYSSRNLPSSKIKDDYTIPEADLEKLNQLVSKLDKTEKMLFIKKSMKDFDVIIQKVKGKKYDIKKERDESGLKPKMFIHSLGLWDEYIKFVKGQLS